MKNVVPVNSMDELLLGTEVNNNFTEGEVFSNDFFRAIFEENTKFLVYYIFGLFHIAKLKNINLKNLTYDECLQQLAKFEKHLLLKT